MNEYEFQMKWIDKNVFFVTSGNTRVRKAGSCTGRANRCRYRRSDWRTSGRSCCRDCRTRSMPPTWRRQPTPCWPTSAVRSSSSNPSSSGWTRRGLPMPDGPPRKIPSLPLRHSSSTPYVLSLFHDSWAWLELNVIVIIMGFFCFLFKFFFVYLLRSKFVRILIFGLKFSVFRCYR